MNQRRSVALVCSGLISRSWAARLPGLAVRLGPVKASSLRVASRAVNTLGAGFPVSCYEDLAESEHVLVSVARNQLSNALAELAAFAGNWRGRRITMFGQLSELTMLSEFKSRGAYCACLDVFDWLEPKQYIVEGSREALRAISPLMGPDVKQLIYLKPGMKQEFLRGFVSGSEALESAVRSLAECLKKSELAPSDTRRLIVGLLMRQLRAQGGTGGKVEGI